MHSQKWRWTLLQTMAPFQLPLPERNKKEILFGMPAETLTMLPLNSVARFVHAFK